MKENELLAFRGENWPMLEEFLEILKETGSSKTELLKLSVECGLGEARKRLLRSKKALTRDFPVGPEPTIAGLMPAWH